MATAGGPTRGVTLCHDLEVLFFLFFILCNHTENTTVVIDPRDSLSWCLGELHPRVI